VFALNLGLSMALLLAQAPYVLRNGGATFPGYQGVEDINIAEQGAVSAQWDPDANYDSALNNSVDGWPADNAVLFKCDVSATIPPGATVSAVQLIVNIVNVSAGTFPLYPVLVDWNAGQATWNQRRTGVPWNIAGALGPDQDRTAASIGSLTAPSSGSRTLTFNALGISTVQQWVNSPTSNQGFIVQHYGVSDSIDFSSTEVNTAANRPILRITYNGGTVANFQNGVSPSAAYSGCSDTVIAHGPAPGGNLEAGGMRVTGGATNRATGLFRFDLSPFPPGTVVTAASLEVNVEFAGAASFGVYPMRVPWTEAGATWTTRDGTVPWSSSGALQAGVDYEATQLALLSSVPLDTNIIALDAVGIALVQSWIDAPASNFGLLLRSESPNNSLHLELSDSENTHTPFRPGLLLQAVVPQTTGSDGGSQAPVIPADLFPQKFVVGCGCGSGGEGAAGLLVAVCAWLMGRARHRR
jgi:hypothetical protein